MFKNVTTRTERHVPSATDIKAQIVSEADSIPPALFSGLSPRSINTAALTWGIRRLAAGRGRDLLEVATRSWEVHPAEVTSVPPAIYLPDTLDRISALSPWRNWEEEQRFISGGQIEHAATQAYLIEDTTIAGPFLYSGTAKMKSGYGSQELIRRHSAPVQHIHEAHLLSNWAGSHYFGMFMRSVLPMELLASPDTPAFSMQTKAYGHITGYRELLSMPCPPMITDARIERLILYRDFGQNASKAERYAEIRTRLRQAVGPVKERPAGIYLKRGTTGEQRIVANEAELETTLKAMGFDIVEPAKLTARKIAERMVDTPLVISVEGSHLAHAIYSLAEGGTLLVLQPPDRLALAFKEFTDRAGLRFAFTIGHPDASGFRVDIDDMKRTLDLTDQERRRGHGF